MESEILYIQLSQGEYFHGDENANEYTLPNYHAQYIFRENTILKADFSELFNIPRSVLDAAFVYLEKQISEQRSYWEEFVKKYRDMRVYNEIPMIHFTQRKDWEKGDLHVSTKLINKYSYSNTLIKKEEFIKQYFEVKEFVNPYYVIDYLYNCYGSDAIQFFDLLGTAYFIRKIGDGFIFLIKEPYRKWNALREKTIVDETTIRKTLPPFVNPHILDDAFKIYAKPFLDIPIELKNKLVNYASIRTFREKDALIEKIRERISYIQHDLWYDEGNSSMCIEHSKEKMEDLKKDLEWVKQHL